MSYNNEVKSRWGYTPAYSEFEKKTAGYSKDKWQQVNGGLNEVFKRFAECRANGCKTESTEAQMLVKELQNYITENYYTCTNSILLGLGDMYVADNRFKESIDKYGSGTAEYVSTAIKIFVLTK